MVTLIVSPALSEDRKRREIEITGSTVEDVFERHAEEYGPELHEKVIDEEGIDTYINVYVNGTEVSMLDGMRTTVTATDHIRVIPAISGG